MKKVWPFNWWKYSIEIEVDDEGRIWADLCAPWLRRVAVHFVDFIRYHVWMDYLDEGLLTKATVPPKHRHHIALNQWVELNSDHGLDWPESQTQYERALWKLRGQQPVFRS